VPIEVEQEALIDNDYPSGRLPASSTCSAWSGLKQGEINSLTGSRRLHRNLKCRGWQAGVSGRPVL